MVLSLLAILACFTDSTGHLQFLPEASGIKFISLNSLFEADSIKNAPSRKAEAIIAQSGSDSSSLLRDSSRLFVSSDSSHPEQGAQQMHPLDTAAVRALETIAYKIQYPDSEHTALDYFFSELDSSASSGKKIRVFHFGDSQIEGDRITSTFRELMQSQFGGCGPGIVPVYEVNDIMSSLNLNSSANWEKVAIYGGLYKGYKARRYGPLGAMFRYYNTPIEIDTVTKKETFQTPFFSYSHSPSAYAHARQAQELSLLLGKVSTPLQGTLQLGKTKAPLEAEPDPEPQMLSFPLEHGIPKQISMSFSSKVSPDIYGCMLDCKSGVAVDNIAMRGSSGTDFHRMDMQHYAAQMRQLGVKLLILQYGVNVVPYQAKDYDFYYKQFYRELMLLKKYDPEVSILVIGVSDMSTKDATGYFSYPGIPSIRDAQRKAAFRAGCAFWDLYIAMGGQNSMPGWVRNSPSLAEKDYTHFNYRGARLIGDMIYKAVMREYYDWKKKPKP